MQKKLTIPKFKILIQDKYFLTKDITIQAKAYVFISFTIIVLFLFLTSSKTIVINKTKFLPQETKVMIIKENNKFSKEKFIKLLKRTRVKFPHIIYAQAWEESKFKSPIFKENNNMFGMKIPGRRPTLAVGVNRGHAVFNSWKECLYDYIFYQCCYLKHIDSEEEYYSYLGSYAENPQYPQKIKKLANQFKKLFYHGNKKTI